MNLEQKRLKETKEDAVPWRRWGPYLSERQWGTVREDYSDNGDAWDYLTHDQARSRAYRWGEDGLAGISDDTQQLCFALALWNGADPILKERLFGLTNSQGNHGEDVKEYYFYLDNTPTHSYMKYLYKYPQSAYPYDDLVQTNGARSAEEFEYELLDTGIFDEDRYFDVFVEYAKESPEDILIQITVHNRGPEAATLHLLPTLWFRNTWSWSAETPKPSLEVGETGAGFNTITAHHAKLGKRFLYISGDAPLLFTENETNNARLFGSANASPYEKDGINGTVVDGNENAINPNQTGTKSAPHFQLTIEAGQSEVVCLRLTTTAPQLLSSTYLTESIRNKQWFHMVNADIISMPDKWEYPWYASWDLAFHTVALAMVDLDFAKHQLSLMLNERYLHPNGQVPAYEWNFSDVNPPVHAWVTLRVYAIEKALHGEGDVNFLQDDFHKLSINFTWWVNRKDPDGNDLFGGGFLGLDNIGVFDRSSSLPTGGSLEQSDGTAWMAFYALSMFQMALELALDDPTYQSMASKYFEHFLWIHEAIDPVGDGTDVLWDNEDGFFYDVLRLPNGRSTRLKVRSLVGLLPLAACAIVRPDEAEKLPEFMARVQWLAKNRPQLVQSIPALDTGGIHDRRLLSLLDEDRLRRILQRMLDEDEFLSPHGIRSISRYHAKHPYIVHVGGTEYRVDYLPAESNSVMFGGNSNWRGPIWFPINYLLLRGLIHLYAYYGDEFTIECPTGSGNQMTLWEVSQELAGRLAQIFLRDDEGRRAVFGGLTKFQTDPHWRDHILFHEYFHGDNGAGLGASHQTGWTGLIAQVLLSFGAVDDFELALETLENLKKSDDHAQE
jgi:hypothetical protein